MGGTTQQLDLSVAQVLGSALAAVTAAVVASFVGVAGTVVGAAVMSVVATVGTAMYTHSMARARDRLRAVQVSHRRRLSSWAVAGAAALVFLLTMGAVSGFELLAGRPLSSLLGRHSAGAGTTVGKVFGGGATTTKKRPSPTPSPTGAASPSAGPPAAPAPSPASTPSLPVPPPPASAPAPVPSAS